jgi:hypothetical protein
MDMRGRRGKKYDTNLRKGNAIRGEKKSEATLPSLFAHSWVWGKKEIEAYQKAEMRWWLSRG